MKSITIKVPLSDGGRIQLQTADLGLVAKILALVHATEGSAKAAKPRMPRAPAEKRAKEAAPTTVLIPALVTGEDAPVKRGRGRPRKEKAEKPAKEAKPRKAKLAKAEEAAARENAKLLADGVRPSVAAMEATEAQGKPALAVVPAAPVEPPAAALPNGAGSFDPDYIERLRQIKKFGELVGAVVEHTGLKTEAELFSHLTQLTPHVPALASIKDKLVGKLKLAMTSLGLLDAADLGYA